jgi:hypothetical protein
MEACLKWSGDGVVTDRCCVGERRKVHGARSWLYLYKFCLAVSWELECRRTLFSRIKNKTTILLRFIKNLQDYSNSTPRRSTVFDALLHILIWDI